MRRSRPSTERSRALADDAGSASIEFIGVGVLMLVPMVYLVLALAQLQAAAFAVEGAARQATRVYVQAESVAEANAAAERAIQVALADFGVEEAPRRVETSCQPDPGDCLTRRGFVSIRVTVEVALPLVPPIFMLGVPASVPMSSTATEQVSRFAGGTG